MCSFPIPSIFKKNLGFLHFKVWRYLYVFGCLATHFIIEKFILFFCRGLLFKKNFFKSFFSDVAVM